jgi:hypothetical protein
MIAAMSNSPVIHGSGSFSMAVNSLGWKRGTVEQLRNVTVTLCTRPMPVW